MSRSKLRIDVCADCGASDPSWASINRGLLLCAECCSVHRSMGRHISHVKSLRQGSWPPSLLAMVHALTAQNVNSIWEHSLLDPTAPKHLRRKPQPKDSLHPTKSEFILAKHLRLAYVLRPRRDEPLSEIGRQLHSAVRSGSLDTSMRLLAQGADPNYFSQEKGTACLHVACRAGHSSQAELLAAWGADPTVRDATGNTAADCARLGGHNELAERMVELVYEVTDRMIYFLTNKKPDHIAGQHFLVPEINDSHEMTDIAKAARGKLQLLPNHLFEELVMDIYDEVDRRDTEAVWQTSAIGLERSGVVFLPVNPALSAPRNQGRQKLARLSSGEMASLIRDVLMDATRRQHIATLKPQTPSSLLNPLLTAGHLKHMSQMSDDEPLYDSVASDDDYASLAPIKTDLIKNGPKMGEAVSSLYNPSVPNENSSAVEMRTSQSASNSKLFLHNETFPGQSNQIELLKRQLDSKDSTIYELKEQLKSLQTIVEKLTQENSMLKISSDDDEENDVSLVVEKTDEVVTSSSEAAGKNNERGKSLESEQMPLKEISLESRLKAKLNQRPASMYETREGPKNNWQVTKHQLTTVSGLDRSASARMSPSVPSAETVHRHAELVTKCIQELWAAMQEPRAHRLTFPDKSDRIKDAVQQLTAIFPDKCIESSIQTALSDLSSSCERVSVACAEWGVVSAISDADAAPLHQLRAAAYDLAKATKLLVTHFPLDASTS